MLQKLKFKKSSFNMNVTMTEIETNIFRMNETMIETKKKKISNINVTKTEI